MTVLQRAEKLTDRLAAEAVRARLDWKYLLGLSLDDPGFDHSVLPEFRARVAEAGLEQDLLDVLLAGLGRGLVKAGGKQRTDSTHVISAVGELNRLELAGESCGPQPRPLSRRRSGSPRSAWPTGRPATDGADSWRLPASQTKRDQLAADYGRDGYALVEAVYAAHRMAAGTAGGAGAAGVLVQNYTPTRTRPGR